MSNAMRKGSLLVVLAAICAVTLMWSPARTHADSGPNNGQTAWTDDSPGGGSTNGDPDVPTPGKSGASLATTPSLSTGMRGSVSTRYSVSASSVSLRGWLQPLLWALRIRLGLY
ncbi:MAG TPA: hypothetical protein VKF80_04930 [Candidatus Eisenbacteria bacterium]|nr:hypothetical protein [Candidatus Eisenbacteria bacterium]